MDQQLNSGIALNSQYFYYWNVEHCGGKPDQANYKWGFLFVSYTVKLACMEFHTQHVPTADNILVTTFCKIGGSKSLDILEAYKYTWKEIYEQSLLHFHEMGSNICYVKLHLIQPHIDIGYSSGYFDHITTFKVLHHLTFAKGGACTHFFWSNFKWSTKCTGAPPLNCAHAS